MSTHKIFSRLKISVERIAPKILADRYEVEKGEQGKHWRWVQDPPCSIRKTLESEMRFHEPELLNKRTLRSGYTTLIASKNLDAPLFWLELIFS